MATDSKLGHVTLLWVDVTKSVREAELQNMISHSCEIRICSHASRISDEVASGGITAICFDMDYPDYDSLNLLRKTKAEHPQVPILMLTLQHSESLAVWAFRSRVFDYFVKPVSRLEFLRGIKRLTAMPARKSSQPQRAIVGEPPAVPIETPFARSSDETRLMPALSYVEQRFRHKVRSADVAKLCDMSPFRFSRAFRETFGLTFQEYVMRHRIVESIRLLRNPDANVTDVAYATGFNDASYFSRMFKRYISMSPKDFIRQNTDSPVSLRELRQPGQVLNLPTLGDASDVPADDRIDRARRTL